ncbi:unnamed protein product [Caenorhabditis sp. 36 PRJEB53466]|nr:unnamed protein product [Caenorhabditis sp. 36 PRJEB53466]
MRAFFVLLLILAIFSASEGRVKTRMCLCAPGQICVQGNCHDYLLNNRVRRDVCGICPAGTYCFDGQCILYPWPIAK